MKMLSPALSVLRHAPTASSVLCGRSPGLQIPSLHLHPQDHLSCLVLPPRPTPRTLMSISDPPRSSSSSLASSPVVGLADPGRRPSCCSTPARRAVLVANAPPPLRLRLGLSLSLCLVCGYGACSWSGRRVRVVRGGVSVSSWCLPLVPVLVAAPTLVGCSRRMHRRPDGGSLGGSPTRGNARASSSAAAGADVDPPYCRASLPFCRLLLPALAGCFCFWSLG